MSASELLVQSYIAQYTSLGRSVLIERARQRNGDDLWAVRYMGRCLARNGEWEWEPQPSSRDDDFLARCRFDSPDAALKAFNEREDRYPDA